MCLVVLRWQPRAEYPLLLVANRDEFRERPAEPMHWWPKEPCAILAGRDLKAGGTWLAFDDRGRFALLTNIRPGYVGTRGKRSRGELPLAFVRQSVTIDAFHQALRPDLAEYGGFNLLLGDGRRLFWFSTDHPQGRWLAPGIHSLSNHDLDTDWPKTVLAHRQMHTYGDQLAAHLEAPILTDTRQAPDDALPQTGVPPETERMLSAQTIIAGHYGTRCRTLVRQRRHGPLNVREVQLDQQGAITLDQRFEIHPPTSV
ncbi:MAG: NRDE family protein [Saccharospirillum sp.]